LDLLSLLLGVWGGWFALEGGGMRRMIEGCGLGGKRGCGFDGGYGV